MTQPIKDETLKHLEQLSGLQFVRVPAGTYTVGESKKASKFATPVSKKVRRQSPICLVRHTQVKLPAFYISSDIIRVSHWRQLLRSEFGATLKKAIPKVMIEAHQYNFVKDYRSGVREYKSFRKDQQEEDPALTLPYESCVQLAEILGAALPEWVQWEAATRGPDAYLYPWGNHFELAQVEYSNYRREDSLIAYKGDLYRLDSFGRYGQALSPFGLKGLARWGMEWNHTSQPLKTLKLDGQFGPMIESHLLRSICDLAFNEVVIKEANFSNVSLARSNHRAFSGTTLAMMLAPEHGHQVAAFRLVYLAEPSTDLPANIIRNLKKLGHLQPRFFELAVFPPYADIPVETVERLWAHTAGFSKSRSKLTMRVMCSFNLMEFTPVSKKNRRFANKLDSYQGRRFWRGKPPYDTIRILDVLVAYLNALPLDRASLHGQLLEAHRPPSGALADLSRKEPYLWDHLLEHLANAERIEELVETVTDLRYLATRSYLYDVEVIKKDIIFAQKYAPESKLLQKVPLILRDVLPLMKRCSSFNDMLTTLYSHLHSLSQQQPELVPLAERLVTSLKPPYLVPQHVLLNWPESRSTSSRRKDKREAGKRAQQAGKRAQKDQQEAEEQTFNIPGTSFDVFGAGMCAISGDGQVVLSLMRHDALKLWDQQTGQERLVLQKSGLIRDGAVSADGQVVVSVGTDDTLNVWDAQTGQLRFTLTKHLGPMWHDMRLPGITGCALSADGRVIVTALNDKLNVWDTETRQVRFTFIPDKGTRFLPLKVAGCAISGDGNLIVSILQNSADLHVWDGKRGQLRFILPAQGAYLTDCVLTHDGRLIVSAYSGQFRGLLKIWDGQTGEERFSLNAHEGSVTGCAVSRDGALIISVSTDQTIKVWDSQRGKCLTTLAVDGPLYDCAVTADGEQIVAIGQRGVYFLQLVR